MTFEDFIRRAIAANCTIENPGHMTFVKRQAVGCTVRHNRTTGVTFIRDDLGDSSEEYRRTTLDAASRALKLARKG